MTPERLAEIQKLYEDGYVYTQIAYVPELILAVKELQKQVDAFKSGNYSVIFHADGREEWRWEK